MDNDKFLADFTRAYIACALWSSTDEDGDSFDSLGLGADDIAPATLEAMRADCARFASEYRCSMLCVGNAEQHGHDFWLIRNGHGAGFWDRGYGPIGGVLTDAAKAYGGVDLYIGDDGKVYA